MTVVTVRYTLPGDQHEYETARLGPSAVSVLWDIDQLCRSVVKHGLAGSETTEFAAKLRDMIREGCPQALEI